MIQDSKPRTISLAITGASGAAYALRLLECLLNENIHVYLMVSPAAQIVLATETDLKVPSQPKEMQSFFIKHFNANSEQLEVFGKDQWMSPVASGSNAPDAMVVCPCTMGTLSAIACGASNNLIERAADVMIKEKRQLIIVPRETPFSPIHLENMLKLANIGVTIMPANPGFYHEPEEIGDLIDFMVARILDHLSIPHTLIGRWSE
ncbi:MAG: UbiX family flavin prenyltransferase [Gammaproteobacteria bacterium]|nr:UbiX family flavin prenyltransferase [Gammaproteobacteria bacterium]MDH5593728.1 UbiX family flavin prenyltransferase [Gammaproteobacteria bacterium]MDH5613917.1 UbiX family flavin prenyltransferase [Gammaproteobacteria bacterium]